MGSSRLRLSALPVLLAAVTGVGPAAAARLVMPDDKPVFYNAYSSPAQPWISQQPDLRLVERPVGELIAIKLGFANGRAELFRYRLENVPSDRTTLNGVVDGGGIRLKLTW